MKKIALDSNTFTYFTDILTDGYNDESDDQLIFDQKVSLLRIYFYTDATLYMLPTVESEYSLIKKHDLLEQHWRKDQIFFAQAFKTATKREVNRFLKIHNRQNDCKILSEAINNQMDALLSFDTKFVERFRSNVFETKLFTPKEYWDLLGIPKGARLIAYPAESNPLHSDRFWIW